MVEFALVAPLLLLILFGIIDFGTTYNNYVAVRQGVREGARQGAVGQFGSTTTCSLHAFGATPSTNLEKLMCLTKNRIGVDANSVYVKISFDTSYAVNQGLIVCALTPAYSTTGFTQPFLNGRFLKSKVEMNIEQVSGGIETAGYETAPSGSDWSWCTASNPSP